MNRLSITGPSGEIRWAYHRAATLSAWRVRLGDDGVLKLTATLAEVDAYRLAQQPVTFVVAREKGPAWCWPIVSLQIADRTLTACLGSQE